MKTNLSLSTPDPESDFQEIVLGTPTDSKTNTFKEAPSTDKKSSFELSENYWKALLADPLVSRKIRELVGAETSASLMKEEEKLKGQIQAEYQEKEKTWFSESQEKGYAVGLEEGQKKAKERLDEALYLINHLSKEILSQKSRILTAHEGLWLRAATALLEKFYIPEESQIENRLKLWLERCHKEFGKDKKLKVFVDVLSFQKITEHGFSTGAQGWEVVGDSNMSAGDLRCETNDEEIYFGAEAALGELRRWVEAFQTQEAIVSPSSDTK